MPEDSKKAFGHAIRARPRWRRFRAGPIVVGVCWCRWVWIHIKLRDLSSAARDTGEPLPARYQPLFRLWFILGWPAFAGVIAILALMVAEPKL